MAIPAAQIVSISPRVLQAGGTDLVLNGLFLTDNSLIPSTSLAMSFPSATAVGEYFGTSSPEYAAASVYFRGYDNSFKKPQALMLARRVDSDAAAYIMGGKYTGTLADLQSITAGTLTVDIDGTEVELSSVDLSAATSLSAVAASVSTALTSEGSTASMTYNSTTGGFILTSGTQGETSSVAYPTGTLATSLNLTEDTGAVLSQGMAVMSVADNLQAIRNVTENWATFTALYTASDDEHLALAAWADAQGVEYLYVAWSTDLQLVSQSDTTSIAIQLAEANSGATTLVYGGVSYAAFICGAVASIDWNRINGTITLAFKSQSGLAATCENGTDAQTLLAKNCNLYGNYATRNDQFIWLYDGSMFGQYNYIDPFVNAVWFNNAIQVSIMNGLGNASRVPYNEDGYTMIRAWIQDPINRAVRNGVINQGMVLSESQKAQVISEAGLDITPALETDGYYLQVLDPGAQARTDRESPSISLWYCYAGSVQKITLASTLII